MRLLNLSVNNKLSDIRLCLWTAILKEQQFLWKCWIPCVQLCPVTRLKATFKKNGEFVPHGCRAILEAFQLELVLAQEAQLSSLSS